MDISLRSSSEESMRGPRTCFSVYIVRGREVVVVAILICGSSIHNLDLFVASSVIPVFEYVVHHSF